MLITINVGDEALNLTEHNSRVYRFRQRPEVDHAYYETEHRQFYIFDCEQLLTTMENQGATLILAELPSEQDEDAFVRYEMSTIDDELDSL